MSENKTPSAQRPPKKLIEVALPLKDINEAAVREKSIRHGHPSTLHLWWARRPLAAARAVLFAQMVNDPGGELGYKRGMSREQAAQEREKLFDIIRDLVQWENLNNPKVLKKAREAIFQSWRETCERQSKMKLSKLPPFPAFHDPFAGGGAIPLEAQRLGLASYASDLNPVAVMINKAMIEIPPKFAGVEPVGPIADNEKPNDIFPGAKGLAEDVRRYGAWMRAQAQKKIGRYYPQVEDNGEKWTVIAWIWARTVRSPNPVFRHVEVPLVSSFVLSTKSGHEAYVVPVIEGDRYHFEVRSGKPPKDADGQNWSVQSGTKVGRAKFRCLISGTPIEPDYIKSEFIEGHGSQRLLAIVAEGERGRKYFSPSAHNISVKVPEPSWKPLLSLPDNGRWFSPPLYGLTKYADLFTPRQLLALTTFSDLVEEARALVERDAAKAVKQYPQRYARYGKDFPKEYAKAVAVYLAFVVDKYADYSSSICTWQNSCEKIRSTYGRHALPMTWDFAETNPFSSSTGNWMAMVDWTWKALSTVPAVGEGRALQKAAQKQEISEGKIVSTDPPYYDNIGYADLSDFFYVWMRRSLRDVEPEIFGTIATPKGGELIATPYRHESREQADAFFLEGMTKAIKNLAEKAHPAFPITIYYAYKANDANAGWVTFLEAVIRGGLLITGTWPMRTERNGRMISNGTNALASSIVLVCQKRPSNAPTNRWRVFRRELRQELPEALNDMTGKGGKSVPIAPVDLAQAAIGPGMAIFSRSAVVLHGDGTKVTVTEALDAIRDEVTSYLDPESMAVDGATCFCHQIYRQCHWGVGEYGEFQGLENTYRMSVEHLKSLGLLTVAEHSKVRLRHWRDYAELEQPEKEQTVWGWCHRLAAALNRGGTVAAGALLKAMSDAKVHAGEILNLAYLLHQESKDTESALVYNNLSESWPMIIENSGLPPKREKIDQTGYLEEAN